ncbi:acetyl-CoA carboxylase biotin carboxyl carrier protein [Ferrovibrio sp.]|uniref:acetyl-CoA carboxylase biotin carboxyl carrier protein n=1 Tax=Ferrovibrio sp. TaxID=1917215 RepID=UPI0025B9BB3A|nr:acetyl-CoA carboxylase biotin carboxyl carrier protein [Ferrovibrio sp.]MBX3455318.1 acetyl-CoA carboxylase biotin carboxyl carrier protein [Ferrovibrio sp.]
MASTPAKDKKPAESRIDQDMIRDLASLLNDTGLTEIEWSEGNLKVRVAKTVQAVQASVALPAMAAAGAVAAPAVAAAADDAASHPGAVKSPMVGTAYLAPDPTAAPFVSVGSNVSAGQTLMIVEAMKTMNPITAPKGGRVARILIENQQPVEFGQVLLVIE